MKHKLVWLTLLCLGAATLLPGFTLEVNAYDMDWYYANGYMQGIYEPPFLDPNDLGAEIWYDSDPYDMTDPVFTGVYTPYQFGAPGNLPFLAGLYYVDAPGYTDWMPSAMEFDVLFYDESVDFLGMGGVSPDNYNLWVDSMPQGFAVYLDGVDTGYQTPATLVSSYVADLVGTYTLAAPPGYQWVPASYTISAADFQPWRTDYFASINFMLMENFYTVFIGPTVPPGAEIWFNGVDTGFTAPHDFTGTAAEVFGTYTLVLPGYQPLDVVVNADNLTPVIPPLVPLIFTLEINAFDFDWYSSNGYIQGMNEPPFLDPNDLQAEIWFDDGLAGPVYTGVQTPYKFGQTGNLPLLDGTYFVQHTQYDELWTPQSFTVALPTADYSVDFLGTQITPPEFNIMPASADFGSLYDGQQANQQFTVTNLGGGTLTLTDITLSGDGCFQFTTPPALPIALEEFETFDLDMTFAPLGQGNYSATLTITDDLSRRTVHTVPLSGTGLGLMYLELTPDSLLVAHTQGTTGLNISSNCTWTVSDDAEWITCSPVSGSGVSQLSVSYLANASTDPRLGTITVVGPDGSGLLATCNIYQSGTPYLNVIPESGTVSAEAGSVTVQLSSNVDWSASPGAGWISCLPAAGSGSVEVTVGYEANPSGESRTATVTFNGLGGTGVWDTFELTQSGAPFLDINPDSLYVSNAAGTVDINVDSNIAWTVSDDAVWIDFTPASGMGDGVIGISYGENTDYEPRTATVTVSGLDGVPSASVSITQEAAFYLIVTPDSLTVSAEAGTATLWVSSNLAWTVSDDADWLSCSPTSGSGSDSLSMSFAENLSTEPRHAYITISGGTFTITIPFTQEGMVSVADELQVPAATGLLGAYPNPFHSGTQLKYALASPAQITVSVYNIKGSRVRLLQSAAAQPGIHRLVWDGRDENGTEVGSGVYYVVLRAGRQVFSRKLTLIK